MAISINLGKKLVLLVMLVTMTALGITSYMSIDYSAETLKQRGGELLHGESDIRGESLRLLFETRIEQNKILANDPMIRLLVSEMDGLSGQELKSMKEEKRRDFLIQVQAFQELAGFSIGFEDTKIIGNNGNVFFSLVGISDEDFSQNEFFQRGLEGSFVDFEQSGMGKKMIVVSPVYAADSKIGDEPIGVIISRMRTAALDNILLNRSGLGETGEVYIVNKDFVMLSESRFFENAVFEQRVDTVGVQECFSNNMEHVGVYPDYRGISIYGSSYCMPEYGIVLLAEMDEEELIEPIEILQTRIILTSLLIILAMGLVAFFAAESLSHPLRALKKAANKIADGNFEVRTNIKTRDEIADLSNAFDLMAQKLQESLIEIKQKDEVIKQLEGDMLLKFSQHEENDCVGVIDMADSTRISSKLSDQDISKLYEIFLNFMAKIVLRHKGEVIKNIGDALMFRFANVDTSNDEELKNILECCLDMTESHGKLDEELKKANLPSLDYKISLTYGPVKVAESTTSKISDVFGPTVNRCFKINSLCPKNSIVVGENVHNIFRDFSEYEFTELCIIELKQKYGYNIFEVRRKGLDGFGSKSD
ncbi:HAMP domain-containing protein [Nitrosopumilus maritimus]|uniref:histidine kinase n=1 Tax=Nitrosopumilus maritimus (strain SCM1) TaxID=436308 RepID=A9A3W2_NITMS|nr:adenylate/guanylate cyclase domain-containing protein [Nitrosopumilus maritimus]ABX13662.1 adenylate/guanylate cyclase with integral membrane sensor [Nitrosopumilus maritimus SCM1]